jgi:hypothetical protein
LIKSITFAYDFSDSLKIEYDIASLNNFDKTTVIFKNKNGNLTNKYNCINLFQLINTQNNYTFELISNTGKLSFNTNYSIYKETFFPILILNRNETKPAYEVQLQDKGDGNFDFNKLNKLIDSAADKIVELPTNISNLQNNTIIFINSNFELEEYSNIKKINVYKHL